MRHLPFHHNFSNFKADLLAFFSLCLYLARRSTEITVQLNPTVSEFLDKQIPPIIQSGWPHALPSPGIYNSGIAASRMLSSRGCMKRYWRRSRLPFHLLKIRRRQCCVVRKLLSACSQMHTLVSSACSLSLTHLPSKLLWQAMTRILHREIRYFTYRQL